MDVDPVRANEPVICTSEPGRYDVDVISAEASFDQFTHKKRPWWHRFIGGA